jgi:hypothetical protein
MSPRSADLRRANGANAQDRIREPRTHTRRSIVQLLLVVVLMGIVHTAMNMLDFRLKALNHLFECVFYLLPFLAIQPVRRFQPRPRFYGLILLAPLLCMSACLSAISVVANEPLTEPLQTFQEGNSTVQLQRYEYGGAVGVHGINLEQRRLIVPGLFLVRSVDFFDSAYEGTLTPEEPYRVRVHAKGSYSNNNYDVDKVYLLKPWLYF